MKSLVKLPWYWLSGSTLELTPFTTHFLRPSDEDEDDPGDPDDFDFPSSWSMEWKFSECGLGQCVFCCSAVYFLDKIRLVRYEKSATMRFFYKISQPVGFIPHYTDLKKIPHSSGFYTAL